MGLGNRVGSLFKRKTPKTLKPSKAPKADRANREVATSVSQLFAQEHQRADAHGVALPRFKASAADQVDRRRSDRFTATRMRLRNAFTPSQPVANRKMFAGRSDVLATMISSIEDQRLHLVIYGERGIGKTSLLHMLAESAREARYIVVYSSCGATSTFHETFRAAATDVPLLFHSDFGPTTSEAETGSSVADLLPEDFTPRQFADVCVKLQGTRVLIVLDEFDRSGSGEFRQDLAELIKFLSDRSVRVHIVIGGVAADLAELVEHIPSIRRNILAMRVPLMTDEEVRQMVSTGEHASGIAFDAAARDMVVSAARGWPYIASLVCHHAGLQALDAGREVVLEKDVAAALEASLAEFSGRMPKLVRLQLEQLLSEGAGKMLTLLAGAALASGGDFTPADLDRAAAKTGDGSNAKRVAEDLAGQQILLERRDDAYGRRYLFVEDSLPPYLWFLGMLQAFQERQTVKAPRAHSG